MPRPRSAGGAAFRPTNRRGCQARHPAPARHTPPRAPKRSVRVDQAARRGTRVRAPGAARIARPGSHCASFSETTVEVGTLAGWTSSALPVCSAARTPKLIRAILKRLADRAVTLRRRQAPQVPSAPASGRGDLRAIRLLAKQDVLLSVGVGDLRGTDRTRVRRAYLHYVGLPDAGYGDLRPD